MENENNVVEEKSTEQKKKSPIGMIILVIVLMIGCLVGGYFLSDSGLLNKKSADTNEKKTNTNTKKEKEVKEVEMDWGEGFDVENVSKNIFDREKSNFNINGIDKEDLIMLLYSLRSNKSVNFNEITGKELKSIAKKYFNLDEVEFVNITCKYNVNHGDNVLYIYNSSTDMYEYNTKHGGHGGKPDGIRSFLYSPIKTKKGEYYIFSMDIFYDYNGCVTDICGPSGVDDIYLTYEDALKKENRVLSAIDAGYCLSDGTNCDYQKVYEAIKDKVKQVKFYYKKVNGNYIFDHYEVK